MGNSGASTSRNTLTPLTGNWLQVTCGYWHTMALSAGATKWFSAGSNFSGQLGLGLEFGNTRSTFTPLTGNWSQMACGHSYTMALSAGTTRLFGTGLNSFGGFGLGDTVRRNTFTALTGNWSQMACGVGHTIALSADTDRWFITGDNFSGQLGLGDSGSATDRLTFIALTGNWSQVRCGGYHTMALSAGTTRLFGTGNNSSGQLGLSDTTNRNTFTALTGNWSQVICGSELTIALSADTDRWFITGRNDNGQLGLGDTVQRNTFTALTGNWLQFICGSEHTMALSAT